MDIITTHKNTDFDGLASVIAGTLLYPGAVGVVPKMVNKNVERFLSTHKTAFNIILPNEVHHETVEKLIVVDTNQWKRLDRMELLRGRDNLTIHLWDHHDQRGDIEASWSCSESIGATVTLMIREMKRRHMSLSPLDSTILLIGLYEDTGHLTYPSTKAEDAEAAAYLLKNGADLNVASVFLNPPYEEVQKDILFKMMQHTEKITHRKITIGINIISLAQKVPMLAAVVNMYRKLINAQAVFTIFINDESSSTVISRSGSSRIDAGAILKHFGGGGHPSAASATIKTKDYSPADIKAKIIEIIKENKISSAVVFDLMTFPVTIVSADTSMKAVREIMEDQKIRGVLVGSVDNLEGIIVLWDFKKIKQDRQWKSPVKAFMKRNVKTIHPDIDPAEAAQIMVKKNIGHLPVEHEGKIIGILTRTDILAYFYDMLPE
jgi:tRNA nucleotidyltransferase (CCA-adding enzyme)